MENRIRKMATTALFMSALSIMTACGFSETKETVINTPTETISVTEAVENSPTPTPGPHEHTYETTVVAPTCTERGYTLYVCACGDKYKDNRTKAIGHSFSSEYVYDNNAEVGINGTESAPCLNPGCKEKMTREVEGTMLDPEWVECRKDMWVIETASVIVYTSCWGEEELTELSPMDKVVLTGTSETPMCRVEVNGVTGYTFFDCLTDEKTTPKPTSTPKPVLNYTFADANFRIYANRKSTEVYEEPTYDSERIDLLGKTYVTVTGICEETGFYRINYSGKTGYIDSTLPALKYAPEDFPYELHKFYERGDDIIYYYYRGSEGLEGLPKREALVVEAIEILNKRGEEMKAQGLCSDYVSLPGNITFWDEDAANYWDIYCITIKLTTYE